MMKYSDSLRKKLILTSLVALLTGLLVYLGAFSSVELAVADKIFQKTGDVNTDIVILGFDDESFSIMGPYSEWTRDYAVELVNRLNEDPDKAPAVIAFDVSFFGERNAETDEALAAACEKSGNVITVCEAKFSEETINDGLGNYYIDTLHVDSIIYPFEALKSASRVGIANPWTDSGYIRRGVAFINYNGATINSFAVEVCKAYTESKGEEFKLPRLLRDNSFIISYSTTGRGEAVEIPLASVLYKDTHYDFAGKIVLVGAYANGLTDQFSSPVNKKTDMFGVEIHANIIASLLAGTTSIYVPRLLLAIISAVMMFVYVYLIHDGKIRTSVIGLAACYVLLLLMIPVNTLFHVQINFTVIAILFTVAFIINVGNHYIIAQNQHKKVLATFKRYVAPEVVNEISYNDMNCTIGGTERDIAVLFVDIRGFTSLSESLDAPTIVTILNKYLSAVTECAFKHRGTVDKFIGDAAMIVYNSPADDPEYIQNAAATALDLLTVLPALNEELKQATGKEIHLGIGIHCGNAVVGNVGSMHRMDYTAIGDTVNTASRLESQAAPGQILISKAYKEALGTDFDTDFIGDITLKGKQAPLPVYSLKGRLI